MLWALKLGLLYTELIQQSHFHPHRFATLDARGTPQLEPIVCLPHHESFDLSMHPGHTADQRIAEIATTFASVGGFMQVMNHPDLNIDALFHTLSGLATVGRWNCTAREAADWWRSTHTISTPFG